MRPDEFVERVVPPKTGAGVFREPIGVEQRQKRIHAGISTLGTAARPHNWTDFMGRTVMPGPSQERVFHFLYSAL
jgi:hypothetical protein